MKRGSVDMPEARSYPRPLRFAPIPSRRQVPVASDSSPVIHRRIALMLCESAAVLEETLAQIDVDAIPHQRLGDRALVAPLPVVETIHSALRARGVYPQIVGDWLVDEEAEEEVDGQVDGQAGDDEQKTEEQA